MTRRVEDDGVKLQGWELGDLGGSFGNHAEQTALAMLAGGVGVMVMLLGEANPYRW